MPGVRFPVMETFGFFPLEKYFRWFLFSEKYFADAPPQNISIFFFFEKNFRIFFSKISCFFSIFFFLEKFSICFSKKFRFFFAKFSIFVEKIFFDFFRKIFYFFFSNIFRIFFSKLFRFFFSKMFRIFFLEQNFEFVWGLETIFDNFPKIVCKPPSRAEGMRR